MKKMFNSLWLLTLLLLLASCSTYQYSSRYIGVNRSPIDTKKQGVEILVDWNRTVTATSDYSITKSDAIKEAEYLCIQQNAIDVVVDPIVKVERDPFKMKKRYRATITGFAGKYAETEIGVEAVKEYDKHEIEKFKLLTDPDFLEYYYSKEQGDVYNIYSSSNAGIEPATAKESLAFIPKKLRKAPKALKKMDYGKARRIRNAGMWMTVGGAVSMFAIGLPMIMSDYEEAGPLFMGLGSVAIGAGIPMWVVGSVKMKKSNASLEMGNTSSGVGLRLKF